MITSYHGLYMNTVVLAGIGIASIVGAYEGAHFFVAREDCPCGAQYHAYDCPEAQE